MNLGLDYTLFKFYRPEILDIEIYPLYPNINSDVYVAAKVIDRYGQIQNAILLYSKDDGKSYENILKEGK